MPTLNKKYFRYSFEVETPEKGTWAKGGTADIKFYKGKYWRTRREYILRRDNYLCQECKRNNKLTEGNVVDHIKPRHSFSNREKVDGLPENEDNLETLCRSCHNSKTAKESNK